MFNINWKHKSRLLFLFFIITTTTSRTRHIRVRQKWAVYIKIPWLRSIRFSLIRATWKLLVFVGFVCTFYQHSTHSRGSLDWRTTWQDLSALESTRWQVIDCEFFRDFYFLFLYFVSDANNKSTTTLGRGEIADKHSFCAQKCI